MSASLARLRKRAAELEQKKQFDRALEVYVQILDEGGKDLDDEDVPLFNRVGDMLMRKGSVTEALGYYERAVDMYAERGYLNNAIALCSKILRQSPGRAAVYYKLARISAKKGFKSDARKNFLEYADRMQKLGMADEAFRALKEFASLYPDQDDVRLVLAELLSKENRKGEALEQLQSLYEKLQSEGRAAEARATIDRMRAIDPSVTPRQGSPTQTPAASDLVFLDLTDAEPPAATPRGSGEAQPAAARAPMPTPVPALTGLSITFLPGQTDAPHPEGFESTSIESEPEDAPPVTRSLTPAASELVVEPAPAERSSPAQVDAVLPLEMAPATPPSLERVEEALEDLLPEPGVEAGESSRPGSMTPLSGFAFADLDLGEETPRGAPTRQHDLSLPGELPETPAELEVIPTPLLESDAAAEDARAAAEEAADLAADIAAREAVQVSAPAWQPPATAGPAPNEAAIPAEEALEISDEPAATLEPDVPSVPEEIPDDFLARPPSFGVTSETADDHAFPPLLGLEELHPDSHEVEVVEPAPAEALAGPTPRATLSIGSAASHLRGRLELEPENWELRRQFGEALLDSGERDDGVHELELAMAGFEGQGDLDRAQEVVDEILALFPGSVAHHQKRVEFAVRSRDRGRLTYSYLELADALFRTGSADKAVAVYSRVLELDPQNERAEFALATLAPDELVKRRGVPVRAERWTDELVAIHAGIDGPNQPLPHQAAAPDESTSGSPPDEHSPATSDPGPQQPAAPRPRVRVNTIELPVVDWGEGVLARAAAKAPQQPPVSEAASQDVSRPAHPDPAGGVAAEKEPPAMEAPDEPPYASEQVEESTVTPAYETPPASESLEEELSLDWPGVSPHHVEEPRRETPDEPAPPRVATPLPVSANRERTPLSVPTPRTPTPLSVPTRRDPTPRSVPRTPSPTPSPVPAIRSDSAVHDASSDFIDLGEWLRNTEPARSTRMQVEDPKPTGDEQADFEEMLRRFKRGVAENVEAEDYDAHYDLGVAYKEMGLIDEAIAQFQKALRGTATRVKSYEALGQCFVEKEQYPIAAALLQRAIELPGSDDQLLVGVLYLLGFATEHMGRPAEARPYYLRVFAVDIEFRDIAERVNALENITT
jgi:tetratricopeptide (TPR) repeat protein